MKADAPPFQNMARGKPGLKISINEFSKNLLAICSVRDDCMPASKHSHCALA
jgi:hypothetical protein